MKISAYLRIPPASEGHVSVVVILLMGMVSLLRDDVTADAKERCCCGQKMIHRIAATLFGRILHHF